MSKTGSWVAYKSDSEFKLFKTHNGAKKFVSGNKDYKVASIEFFVDKIKK